MKAYAAILRFDFTKGTYLQKKLTDDPTFGSERTFTFRVSLILPVKKLHSNQIAVF